MQSALEQSAMRILILAIFPPLSDEFWKNAKRFSDIYRPQKKQITVRLDADVLDWLKSSGKGYQTRLNDILRHEMQKQLQTNPQP